MDCRHISTLIVDDEPVARKLLREELETFEDVEIVGEAANGKEALQQITKLKPDLVFFALNENLTKWAYYAAFPILRTARSSRLLTASRLALSSR